MTVPSVPVNPDETNSDELISEVIENHIAEKKSSWKESTEKENRGILSLFNEIVGDVPISSINRKKIGEFRQTLMKLPANRNKSPEYRDKSISELLQMEVSNPMSSSTVNKYLTRIGALFKYAIRFGFYEGENPATEMTVSDSRLDNELRAAYKKDELIKLFHSQEYLNDEHDKPFKFWMPILALYTGARLNELAQLHLTDIRMMDGVWVFDINGEDGKTLKAKYSKRLIPIHKFLLNDLKIVSCVEYLKSKSEERLFPELKKQRDGYGQAVSKWFNRTYKNKCGIESNDGRMRDFHSFRSTFITHLTHKGVNDRMRLQVEGHSPGKDMTSVYAESFPAQQIYDEVISRLDYGIDLSHLKKSKYVNS